jgi:integrase
MRTVLDLDLDFFGWPPLHYQEGEENRPTESEFRHLSIWFAGRVHFPDKIGGWMDTGNYRRRVLRKLVGDLKLPKLTFQVIRRTIATLVPKKGAVKDVQAVLRHSRVATTTDVYMQEIPESVREQL